MLTLVFVCAAIAACLALGVTAPADVVSAGYQNTLTLVTGPIIAPATPTTALTVTMAAGLPTGLTGQQLVGKAVDVDIQGSAGTIDISTRSSAGFREHLQGMKDWSSSISHLFVGDDAGYKALRNAWITGAKLYGYWLDPQGYGFAGAVIVTKIGRAEKLEGALVCAMDVKGTGPLWIVEPTPV